MLDRREIIYSYERKLKWDEKLLEGLKENIKILERRIQECKLLIEKEKQAIENEGTK